MLGPARVRVLNFDIPDSFCQRLVAYVQGRQVSEHQDEWLQPHARIMQLRLSSCGHDAMRWVAVTCFLPELLRVVPSVSLVNVDHDRPWLIMVDHD